MKIKSALYLVVFVFAAILAQPGFSQEGDPIFASIENRLEPTKIIMETPPTEARANTFWYHYDNYRDHVLSNTLREHEALKHLSQTTRTTNGEVALLNGMRMISYSLDELKLKRNYYGELAEQHSGIFGLNFLHMEVMLDMVETSAIYEQTDLRNFHFAPDTISADQRWKAKYGVLVKALELNPIEEKIFLPLFIRYDQESEEYFGKQYQVYMVFSRDPSELTSALAKRHGYDLLDLLDIEVRLKEKYFNEVNAVLGPAIAARFLAWEDYYSTHCKLAALSGK